MAIIPNGSKSFVAPTGGSPRGWSFIGAALDCWSRFAKRYVYGLYPLITPDYFDLGSAYHALQEGKSEAEVGRLYPEHLVEAKRLVAVRAKGPPMPPLSKVVAEKELPIFGGLMTSKPDRIEKSGTRHIVRDFKTSFMFSKNDEQHWGVNGGLLGECIAGDTDTALADIVTKREDAQVGTKMVTVKLTPDKRAVLEYTVQRFWKDLEARTKLLAKAKKPTPQHVMEAFTPNMNACVGKYSVCAYYARCWEKGTAESMQYVMSEKPPRNWAEYKPVITWREQLDAAYEKTKRMV